MPGKYGKNTHSLHLLLICFAQHGLLEHAPVLHYTYITCLVNNNVLFIKHFFFSYILCQSLMMAFWKGRNNETHCMKILLYLTICWMNHNGMFHPKKNILNRWSVTQRVLQSSFRLYTERHVLPYCATICGLYMSPQLRAHAGKVEGHLQFPFPINTIKLTIAWSVLWMVNVLWTIYT
jgi:hypothetical protein